MRLKPNFGYWDLRFYPIGGDFKRCGENGLKIKSYVRLGRPSHGSDVIAIPENWEDANTARIACKEEDIEN